MSHLHRFYIPGAFGATVQLPPDEAHHALRVVRAREGERVALFDGRGRELLGRVSRCTKHEVEVAIEETREWPRPVPAVTLAVAALHQEKAMEFIIRHGTELGVIRFIFFRAQRSERAPKPCPKWEKLAIEACKQSGHLWLPDFVVAASLPEALETVGEGLVLIAALEGPRVAFSVLQGALAVTVVIGPEGDFTPEELALACSRGAKPISLGPTTLRSEMAALVAATLVNYEGRRMSQNFELETGNAKLVPYGWQL